MKFFRAIALLCAVAGLCLAQTPPTKKAAPAAPAATKKPARAAEKKPDAAIEKNKRGRLEKPKPAGKKYNLWVRGGAPPLPDKTEVGQQKGTATRMAKSAGATSVVNNIE